MSSQHLHTGGALKGKAQRDRSWRSKAEEEPAEPVEDADDAGEGGR
jgi:hypothetical protein